MGLPSLHIQAGQHGAEPQVTLLEIGNRRHDLLIGNMAAGLLQLHCQIRQFLGVGSVVAHHVFHQSQQLLHGRMLAGGMAMVAAAGAIVAVVMGVALGMEVVMLMRMSVVVAVSMGMLVAVGMTIVGMFVGMLVLVGMAMVMMLMEMMIVHSINSPFILKKNLKECLMKTYHYQSFHDVHSQYKLLQVIIEALLILVNQSHSFLL